MSVNSVPANSSTNEKAVLQAQIAGLRNVVIALCFLCTFAIGLACYSVSLANSTRNSVNSIHDWQANQYDFDKATAQGAVGINNEFKLMHDQQVRQTNALLKLLTPKPGKTVGGHSNQ